MKTYKERLPMIDEAIEYHKGKWPVKRGVQEQDREGLFYVGTTTKVMQMSHGPYTHKFDYVCNQEEFEIRAPELGWINGYKYGVEYPTNGKKPDLPDDVEVKVFNGDFWLVSWSVGNFQWDYVCKFRIADERYEPKEPPKAYLLPDPEIQWDGDGFPPVGTKVEYRAVIHDDWQEYTVIGVDEDSLWLKKGGRRIVTVLKHVRPLRTERDRLIEVAKAVCYPSHATGDYIQGIGHAIRSLIDNNWRPTEGDL